MPFWFKKINMSVFIPFCKFSLFLIKGSEKHFCLNLLIRVNIMKMILKVLMLLFSIINLSFSYNLEAVPRIEGFNKGHIVASNCQVLCSS